MPLVRISTETDALQATGEAAASPLRPALPEAAAAAPKEDASEKPSPIYMRRDAVAAAAAAQSAVQPQGPIVMTRLKVNAPRPPVTPPPASRPPPAVPPPQPLAGIRLEDPSLPLPRFTPAPRKMRPLPIDVLSGIEKAKVGSLACRLHACWQAFL